MQKATRAAAFWRVRRDFRAALWAKSGCADHCGRVARALPLFLLRKMLSEVTPELQQLNREAYPRFWVISGANLMQYFAVVPKSPACSCVTITVLAPSTRADRMAAHRSLDRHRDDLYARAPFVNVYGISFLNELVLSSWLGSIKRHLNVPYVLTDCDIHLMFCGLNIVSVMWQLSSPHSSSPAHRDAAPR